MAFASTAHTYIPAGVTFLCICDDQLNTLLLQLEKKTNWCIKLKKNRNLLPKHLCALTRILVGSVRPPSLFHVTVLSGDDDLQSTAIESPGCKYDRAGSNFTVSTGGGSKPCWDAIICIERRKIKFINQTQYKSDDAS